ncbi:protein kinase [Listeria floridensis FSL S10-1187]|uniref:non-specific serine/threonine protein kinase n=1 Tax=Listeria floridensis FSL S10-1187 TaxID=1265817 RepID=A0ABP3B0Q3_9LIST|nr:Stk1 family PASTA domain-containing Ser/Thr kinase [Listeria floridensis]EUJ33460.1 protein kinase [Listeria floridensis FSL S10-1187]
MMIGKRLSGRYKILSPIGGGGMANVFLAHDMILNRDVAVKILRIDLADESNLIRRFQREAQSATSLDHPNIVSIYDVGEENDLHYIVMEHVDGMDLKQYIQENHPIPFDKAVDIMRQIVSAVSAAHQHHIIHRDIKPQNILIDRKGVVKITDFGIAMALSETSITQTNSLLGSVHYLSPEQARGGMATQKSDIYSLGIVLYELLSGEVPYDGESAVSIAIKHLQAKMPSVREANPAIPQSLENIIIKATAKDPFARYQSVEEMEEDLRTCLDPERLNEPKYMIKADDGDTKTIPIVLAKDAIRNLDETVVPERESDKTPAEEKKPKEDAKKGTEQGKKKNKSKKKKVFWIVLVIILLFAGLITTLWALGREPDEVEIPDLAGKTEAAAMSLLQREGFTIGKTVEKNSDTVKEGRVIKSNPEAGEMKIKGTKVTLYISIGSKKISMEDFSDKDYDDAKAKLSEQGFKSVDQKEEYSDTVEAGMIISQDPAAGAEVIAKETNVMFTVSKGKEPMTLKDLSGYNQRALDDYAASTGITIKTSEEYSDTVEKGQVISQSPGSGASINAGDTIQVVLSRGPKEKEVKKVTRTLTIPFDDTKDNTADTGNEDAADENTTPTPQHIVIYIEDKNHSMSSPYREMDITKNTNVTLTFEVEEGSKAAYKVMRDGETVDEGNVDYPG